MQVGMHFADVWINQAKDAQEKATLEQERTKLVRRTALACTIDNWPEEARGCIASATTREAIQVCQKKLAPPVARPTPAPIRPTVSPPARKR
jgi:hypothetical protein